MSLETAYWEVTTSSPEETSHLGNTLGQVLTVGAFVGLSGPLGAGKTHFVRGVAVGAQVPVSEVASPTFAIVYTYEGRLTLHHADFYRLENEDELFATGFYELLNDTASASLVEWLERVPSARPKDALLLSLLVEGDTKRRLIAQATGEKSKTLLAQWQKKFLPDSR